MGCVVQLMGPRSEYLYLRRPPCRQGIRRNIRLSSQPRDQYTRMSETKEVTTHENEHQTPEHRDEEVEARIHTKTYLVLFVRLAVS